jgi:polyhydroxybutyrate depolymerase
MASVLACRAADRFAAFGPVALELHLPACGAPRPVPIAAFHGTGDPIVPFEGGPVHCCGGASVPSVAQSMTAWAAQDRCAVTPTDTQLSPMVVRREWTGCAPGGQVILYVIQGGGHTWPGAALPIRFLGATTTEISAADVLWRFFQEHPLP